MGCWSKRVKAADIRPEQKWEFISLNDFHSTSYLTPFAYGYLWVSLSISLAVYSVDIFTAINLLAFHKWSSEIKPVIPIDISRWIFSACIIASLVNLAFEHIRAIRVIRRGAVAESYLDSLAARLQSTRLGKGRGWRRFLVFAELTKSKKGVEYVALFTYFSFQSWIRIIFCQGPRQVINAITLYSILGQRIVVDRQDISKDIVTVSQSLTWLFKHEQRQSIILCGMVFTFVIWALGALSLLIALLLYVLFLWHYIPHTDGGLSGYCERKINTQLSQIVSVKVNKAIEEEERNRLKVDPKALARGNPTQGLQATLPVILNEKLSGPAVVTRNASVTSLSQYSSQSMASGNAFPSVYRPRFQERPSSPASFSSVSSYEQNAPILDYASQMGINRVASPAPFVSSVPNNFSNGYVSPQRTGTSNSMRSYQSSNLARAPGQYNDASYQGNIPSSPNPSRIMSPGPGSYQPRAPQSNLRNVARFDLK
ncbi:hypothetical protein BGHDH14_bgh02728 [Blumeria hordei DH14]|uniref:Vacuolar membrane protein n=1 Tax=Blumeria graminis f. sp. hordei (strain DH14) TaxID=546991 RepID=N1J4W7_BLUG1|nr:hypothetical protein BGHDH14_bgh02728 [Blumeria hordei DH14]